MLELKYKIREDGETFDNETKITMSPCING